MTCNYAYTPQIWPLVCTVLLLIALVVYSARRRNVPGATPFMIGCLFAAGFAFGALMETAAVDLPTKIFWFKFASPTQLSIVTAITCFILDYAWPGRWLTRRNLVLLSIPCLLLLGLMLTNDLHHLIWREFVYAGKVIPQRGPANWIGVAYAFGGLGALNLIAFGCLFLRSPQHRWAVVIMLAGQFVGRTLYTLEAARRFQSALQVGILGMALEFLMYAIVLFGFRILDPIPLARRTVIQQLQTGMLVLDHQGMVVSLNPAAQAILGRSEKHIVNHSIRELLPACAGLLENLQAAGTDQAEISLGAGTEAREYRVEASPLKDWRGLEIGRLLLLHDVTELKLAQVQILEQQRALAALQERELVAREMHDSLGQVLAYVRMQAQAARDWLAQDQKATADSSLAQLMAVAQNAHTDVREYIMGARSATSIQSGFLPALQQYLRNFSELYLLRTELIVPQDRIDNIFEPTVEAQLLRIIQEALTNTRKHAQAQCVEVHIQCDSHRAQVIVKDDGLGFDPALLANGERQKYGLGFMRERAEGVNGSVEIHSTPGKGTRVVVDIPLRGSYAGTSG